MLTLDDVYSSDEWLSLGDDDKGRVISSYIDTFGEKAEKLWDDIYSSEEFSSLEEDDQAKVRDTFTVSYGIKPILPFENQEPDGALQRGMSSVGYGLDYAKAMATGDTKAAAQAAADLIKYRQDNPGSKEGSELMEAWQAGDGVLGGISNVWDEVKNDASSADGAIATASSVWDNVKAMGEGLVEQAPNMIAPLAGNLLGGLLGAAGGSVAPIVGTTAGGIAGAFAGGAAGNMLVEGLPMVIDAMVSAGVNLNDTDAVSKYLDSNYGDLFQDAGVKGTVLSAVDLITMKAGSSILKAMPKEGIGNLARNALAAATEPTGEFAGEFLGTGLATGNYDTKNAALEAVSSMGQSGVTFAGQKVYEAFSTNLTDTVSDIKTQASEKAAEAAQDFVDADNIDDLLEAHATITSLDKGISAIEATAKELKTELDNRLGMTMSAVVQEMEKETPAAKEEEPAVVSPYDQWKAELAINDAARGTAKNAITDVSTDVSTAAKEADARIEEYQPKGVPTATASESAQVFEEAEPTQKMQKVEEVLDAFSDAPETFISTTGQPFKTKASLQLSAKNRGVDLTSMDVVQNSDGGWVATAKTERSKAADNAVRSAAATTPITATELPAETIAEYAQNADIRSTATGTSPIVQPTISDAVMQESASNSDIRSTATGTAVSSTPISDTDLRGYAADATIRDTATGTAVSNVEPTEAAPTVPIEVATDSSPVVEPVTIVKADGKPFSTEPAAKAALKAKKLDPATHSVIKSGEGWAITNNTAPAADTSAPAAVTEAQPDRTKPNPTVTRFAMADQSEYQAIASSLSAKEVDDTLAYIGEDFDENYTAITKALNEAKEKPAAEPAQVTIQDVVDRPAEKETSRQRYERLRDDVDAMSDDERGALRKKYSQGNDDIRRPLEVKFTISGMTDIVYYDIQQAATPHDKYLIITNLSGAKRSKMSFPQQVDLNRSLKAGKEFSYFELSPRNGYSVVTFLMDQESKAASQPASTEEIAEAVGPEVVSVSEPKKEETVAQETKRLERLDNTEAKFTSTPSRDKFSMFVAKQKSVMKERGKPKFARQSTDAAIKNTEKFLRRFVANVPEFKTAPVLTVTTTENGKVLRFNDSYQFDINPEVFAIDYESIKDGDKVRVDIDAWFGISEDREVEKYVGFGAIAKLVRQFSPGISNIRGVAWTDQHMIVKGAMPTDDRKLVEGSGRDLSNVALDLVNLFKKASTPINESSYETYSAGKDGYVVIGGQTFDKARLDFVISNTSRDKQTSFAMSDIGNEKALGIKKGDDVVAVVMPLKAPDDLIKSSQGRWTPATKNKKPTIDGDLFQAIADVTKKNKPSPKLSVAAPSSTQSSLSELTPSQREAADALIASGQVEMVTAEEAAKVIGDNEPILSEEQKVQGFVANGKTYIVAENIESGNLWSVMRHEIGVHVGQLLHSNKEFQLLLKTIASRRNESGKEGDAIRAAFARVPSDTTAANVNEEALAYLVEAAPEVGLVRRAIAMVKKFLTSLGISPSIFTHADLAALADVAIRRQAAQAGPVASSSETQFSISPFTKSISKAKEIALSQGAADLIENTYTYLGDADAPIQFTQKAMGKQVEARDYNLVRRLEGKKVANQIKEFDEKEISPYIKKLAKAKLTHADTNEFAHAVHAPERNRQMKRVNARQYLDAVLKQFTDKEKEAITARLDEISDDAVMNGKPLNEKRDAVIQLAEEVFAEYDARVAIADARQAKLDARTFTQDEIDKGTPEYIQKLIDKSRTRLELQKGVIDQWNDVKDRLSGMTNAESKSIRDKWAADPRYEDVKEAASTLMRWSSENLEIAYKAGELTKEEYEAIKGAYRYHVPLNREDQDATYQVGKKGVGPLTKPIKAATGSTKKVETIVGHVVTRRQNALARAERLASGKVLYEMVKENGDEEFFTIDTPKTRSLPDAEGNIRRTPDHQWDKSKEILVKVDGTTHVITANRDNPRAMSMVKAVNRDPLALGPVMKASQKVTRVLAMLNTTLTPEFMVTNFFRDIQTAVINMTDSEAKGMQKRVLKDVGKAWKAINNQEQGKASGPMGDMYTRLKNAGGKIGWMQSYDEVADLAKKLDFDLEVAEGKHWTREKTDRIMKFAERWNTATENSVRLATFSNLVQSGVSDKKAAYIVSNLTVDFTRHGTGGPAINALYMFANAGIQGNIRMVKALVRSPNARKLAGGIFGMGLAANFMGAMMGGDDDDGMSRYDKLKKSRPDLFERNMVFMFPGLDEPVKIPMPYGYNLFYVAGEAVADMVRGKASPLEVSSRIGMAAISVFSPMQGGSVLQALSPTLVDPITMAMENKTWYGGDLMPKLYQSDSPNKPDSSRYFSDVNVYAKGVTTFINELTGGSEYRKGFADVSPETIEMLVETYTGSVGRLAKDTLSLATAPLTGEEIGINKIPFVRKVYGGGGKGQDSQIFKDNLEAVKTLVKEYEDADGAEKREIASDPAFSLRATAKTTESLIRKTRKNMKAAEERGDDASVERYKDRLNDYYIKFNTKYNAAMNL